MKMKQKPKFVNVKDHKIYLSKNDKPIKMKYIYIQEIPRSILFYYCVCVRLFEEKLIIASGHSDRFGPLYSTPQSNGISRIYVPQYFH